MIIRADWSRDIDPMNKVKRIIAIMTASADRRILSLIVSRKVFFATARIVVIIIVKVIIW